MIWDIGNTFLSITTYMLKNFIKMSINYCITKVNEYCKDSYQYLESKYRKKNKLQKDVNKVTADLKTYNHLKF